MSIKSILEDFGLEYEFIDLGFRRKERIEKAHQAILAEFKRMLPKEREAIKYKVCSFCVERWINEEDKGYNQCLQDIKAKLHSEGL